MDDDDEREIKVFAQLYGCGFDHDDQSVHDYQRPITRRMAYYLWSTATVLHDEWRMFARDFENGDLWRGVLPPVAERWATREWLARFAQCFSDVADRLRSGTFSEYGIAHCTGDEVAVVLVLQLADARFADGELALPDNFDELLAPCGEGDEDFSSAHDVLTADADVELLWDMSLDGIENDASAEMRYVNLHPRDWFLPFT